MPQRRKPVTRPDNGDCVRLSDGRVARVRGRRGSLVKVRVRRQTSKTHEFVMCPADSLKRVPCPKGWMSPDGYQRYLRVTLRKMRERRRVAEKHGENRHE